MSKPLVSVIVPAYNCERFVKDSVLSALNQTMGDLEVIAIDDASTDRTYEILYDLAKQDPRIRLLQNKGNRGVARTRNKGFSEATGEFIAFLDSDDIWQPDKLRQQLAFIAESGYDFCYTAYSFINECGQAVGKLYQVPDTVTLEGLIRENVIGCSTVLCKAELLKLHSMRPEYAHEDYVLWLEILKAGYRGGGLSIPLVQYRLQQGSRSANKRKAAKNRWRIYRDFLKMPVPKAAMAFLHYSAKGLKKHVISSR